MAARKLAAVALVGLLAASMMPPAQAFAQAFWPTQGAGNAGVDVEALQRLLAARGYLAPATGVFDPLTEDAVVAFQADQGLAQDGIVGPLTWARLVVPVRAGDEGEAVRAVQRQLNVKRAAGLEVDGDFGAATHAAVVRFQAHAGLAQDGIVGPATWRDLLWHYAPVDVALPELCGYSLASERWGTGAAVGQLGLAAAAFWAVQQRPVSVGDLSLEHGGDIPGHVSHEVGLDADTRPMRLDGAQCAAGCTWQQACYDRTATLLFVVLLHQLAPGHVKVVWFNDPVLIALGLTEPLANHDNHLHVRWCEAAHPDARYAC